MFQDQSQGLLKRGSALSEVEPAKRAFEEKKEVLAESSALSEVWSPLSAVGRFRHLLIARLAGCTALSAVCETLFICLWARSLLRRWRYFRENQEHNTL